MDRQWVKKVTDLNKNDRVDQARRLQEVMQIDLSELRMDGKAARRVE